MSALLIFIGLLSRTAGTQNNRGNVTAMVIFSHKLNTSAGKTNTSFCTGKNRTPAAVKNEKTVYACFTARLTEEANGGKRNSISAGIDIQSDPDCPVTQQIMIVTDLMAVP